MHYNYASAGTGSASHLAMASLLTQAGLHMQHIPLRSNSDALIGVSTELVDGAATVAINVKALKSNPRIVLLAYSGAKRATSLPELPTVAEAGVPMYAFETWTGLLAPAGTPKPEMEKINRAMAVVSTTPVVLDRLHELGAEFSITSMEAFQEFLRVDWQRTGVQVRAAGAMLN